MRRKGNIGMVASLVAVVIGIVVLSSIISSATELNSVTNESHTISATPEIVTLDNGDIHPDTLIIANESGRYELSDPEYEVVDKEAGDVNITSEYNITENGDTLLFTYDYEPEEYIGSGLVSTIFTYVPVFVAISALVFAVGFGRKYMK